MLPQRRQSLDLRPCWTPAPDPIYPSLQNPGSATVAHTVGIIISTLTITVEPTEDCEVSYFQVPCVLVLCNESDIKAMKSARK